MLHQRLARALEKLYAEDLEPHAAELAEHFAQTGDRGDLEKALHHARVAAERATPISAHGEAVRYLSLALQIGRVLWPNKKASQCDLLLAIGQSIVLAGETADARTQQVASEGVRKLDECSVRTDGQPVPETEIL
jgi:hypothetical protein